MDAERIIAVATAAFDDVEAVRGLFLTGSRGSAVDDAWSDVDFVASADEGVQGEVAGRWRAMLDECGPVVHAAERNQGPTLLLNAVTEDWLRVDLVLLPPALLGFGRARDRLRVLIDRDNAAACLPASLPPRAPDPARVRHLVSEFIRVMGLLPVVIGRAEWVVAQAGTGMLRGFVQELLTEESPEPDRGGALHLRRLLPPGDIALLESLPVPPIEGEAIVAAHIAIARVFMPRARALCLRLQLDWPDAFEQATRRRLLATLGPATAEW